jgi:hypothetical protein
VSNPTDSYWDLMADLARLQARLGEDLVAWARMYQVTGQALQRSGGTLQEMSELGRRMQGYLESGPPAVVSQILRMFVSPFAGLSPGMGMGIPPGATPPGGPFAQLWEAWTSGAWPPPSPPESSKPT